MGESKLFHAMLSALLSALSAAWAWFAVHGKDVATILAIVAALYSIRAGYLTTKMRKHQLRALKDE